MSSYTLPPIIAGETIRSFVERVALLNAMSLRQASELIFGAPWLIPTWELPRALDRFAANVGRALGYEEGMHWLDAHTHAPYYASTLAKARRDTLTARLLAVRNGPVRPVLPQTLEEWFRKPATLCPECDHESFQTRGFSHVQREWMLPFSTRCTLHDVPLRLHQRWSVAFSGKHKAIGLLPWRKVHGLDFSAANRHRLSGGSQLLEVMGELLQSRGYTSRNGSVRRTALEELVLAYSKGRFEHPELDQLLTTRSRLHVALTYTREEGEPHQLNIGKGTYIGIYDRDRGKALGWHFYTGEENWREGYRLALFCALTSKLEHLEYLEIQAPEAFPDEENIRPQFVYADGGSAVSLDAIDALERLRIEVFVGPPDTPYWKPTVEGGMGRSQHAQAHKPGGYRRTNRARDKERKRIAKLTATDSAWETERDIVLELIDANSALNKRHLLTYEMKVDGVRPSSDDIFSWTVANLGDSKQRVLNEAVVYMSLLSRAERQVTLDGISFFGNQYRSLRLLEERTLQGKNFKAKFAFHPNRPQEIYWVTPEGALDRLTRDKASQNANGTMSFDEMELYELKLTAAAILKAAASSTVPKKKARLTGAQTQNLLEAAGVRSKKVRNRPTPNEKGVRAVTAALTNAEQTYDTPERHAPKLAAQPPIQRASTATADGLREESEGQSPSSSYTANRSTLQSDASPPAPPAPSTSGRQSAADLFSQLWKKKRAEG